jgi:hypothetical protein
MRHPDSGKLRLEIPRDAPLLTMNLVAVGSRRRAPDLIATHNVICNLAMLVMISINLQFLNIEPNHNMWRQP